MKVTRVASTSLQVEGFVDDTEFSLDPIIERWMLVDHGVRDADALAEFAGRGCYLSYSKPNPKTQANADYLANIIRLQHESVLEHASVSYRVEGVSRNLLLELERHRHLSFSVLSQRYVSGDKTPFVYPPGFDDLPEDGIHDEIDDVLDHAYHLYDQIYQLLIDAGKSHKQARESARAVLPGGTETKFVVTGNLRAWRHVIDLRYSPAADAEIQDFAALVLKDLKDYAPNTMADKELWREQDADS